ncbi:MAG: response regulator [Deltaproteobacteria bacterium]|nr:response regulator [Deltaproteobacteria bacterium]
MSIVKRMNNLRVYVGLIISLISVYHAFVFPANAETIQQKNVLLLHADNPLLPANIIMDHNFNTILKLTNPRPVALYSEYLEIVRFHSEIVEKKTLDLLKEKYSKLKIDLIIITDDQSWDYMIAHGKDVFQEAPIVFCGITEGKIDENTLKPNMTGNFKHLDVKSSFENILHIQPDTKEIYVIVGTSEQDAFYEAFAHNTAAEYSKKVKITFVKGLSIEDTQKKISDLPGSTAVLYIAMYKDGTGKTFNPRDALFLLNKTANVPIYSVSDTYLGYGMMGGNLLSFTDFSKNAAEIALQVLNGKSPAEIPAVVSQNKNYFDFKEMQRWGIHEKNLPQGSIIINKKPGLWDLYRWQIISAMSIGISGLLLIFFLIFQIHLKRKARAEVLEVNCKLEKTNRMLEADVTERKQSEEALRESETRLRTLLRTIPDLVWLKDPKGIYLFCNSRFESFFGAKEKDIIGKTDYDFVDKKLAGFFREHDKIAMAKGKPINNEEEVTFADGHHETLDTIKTPMYRGDGQLAGVLGIGRNITDRVNLQAQLIQAQKMESVGRLAGGVAHDYNNALSVIIGFTELAMDKIDPAEPLQADLNEVLMAARHATDITRQLLAFARKQTIALEVLDLNENIEAMLKMLRRLIGEDIDLAWLPGTGLWPVKMDPSQIDQILANLCVNARDAIVGVGKVNIETANKVFDSAYCADHVGFIPGEFVLMAISDNGCGMDKEILNNIFEPFFTTKDVGKGTGLGLATVYGIVKQNNGFINVYSEPGKGTTIKIYLPRYEGKAVEIQEESTVEIPSGIGETILVVEDDLSVLKLAHKILDDLGYTVLLATTPGEALGLTEEHAGEIHLLVTDVIMPEMNGHELATRLQSLCPDLKCIFMSGYTRDAISHHGVLDEGVYFVQKPFSKKDLAKTVRKVLDEGKNFNS